MDWAANEIVCFSPSIFPVEIICHILVLLGPLELLPLKTVSRQFRSIINDRTFWSTVYAGAQLSRPPGPFSWQSIKFFQRTLVRSARLAQHWTSRPANVFLTRSFILGPDEECKWVGGRWLIICRGKRQLVSHDIDTGVEQTLCQWDDRWMSWSATCCVASTRGHLLYVALFNSAERYANRVELLEFQVDDDSGHLSGPVTFDVAVSFPTRSVSLSLESGDTPLIFISVDRWRILSHSLVFDTRSRLSYTFPDLELETDTDSPIRRFFRLRCQHIVLTTTHIITSRRASDPAKTLVQVYVIPDNSKAHELCLSHETIIDDSRHASWALLRDSVVDPVTGSTSMRVLITLPSGFEGLQFCCADFNLPAHSPENVLPISIDTHPVFAMDNANRVLRNKFIQGSANGLARGWCDIASDLAVNFIRKFSIDATGERCVGTVGHPFSFWPGIDLYESRIDSFDGSRGRMCCTVEVGRDKPAAIVLDLK